ncbi:MAG TPA: EamA family transporter [Propioniciclava tarda]|nr:EamA family transporter [Propioniciclava tarda]HQA31039.1 EamA family transporter [Propioniciclava tarda]HQD61117.1 EamA family transporter [Propioniciclava tarda]
MRVPPVLLVLVSIASVQLGSSFAKDLFSSAPPQTVAWLRLAFGALILTVIARPRLAGRTRGHWGIVFAYGLAMAVMNLVFYLAIQRIPIGMAVTLEFLGPLVVAIIGSRRVRDYLWAGLAFVGVAMLGFTPGDLDPLGIVLALLAGALWAGYIVLAGPTGRSWSGVTGVTVACWVGTFALAAPALASAPQWVTNPKVWLLGAVVGLLSSVVPYGLEMIALRTIDRGAFGILMSLEPAAAALFAFALLHEQLRPIELAAMACVIVASVGATRSARHP